MLLRPVVKKRSGSQSPGFPVKDSRQGQLFPNVENMSGPDQRQKPTGSVKPQTIVIVYRLAPAAAIY
jgi:hypothetical protein